MKRRTIRSSFSYVRGACESVRRSEAPLSLPRTLAIEKPHSRIDRAADNRCGRRICCCSFFRALRHAARCRGKSRIRFPWPLLYALTSVGRDLSVPPSPCFGGRCGLSHFTVGADGKSARCSRSPSQKPSPGGRWRLRSRRRMRGRHQPRSDQRICKKFHFPIDNYSCQCYSMNDKDSCQLDRKSCQIGGASCRFTID